MTLDTSSCPSSLVLDRIFVGDLTDPVVKLHTEACPRCRAEIVDREHVAARFSPVATAPGFTRLVEAVERDQRTRQRRLVLGASGAALAAAAAVTLAIALPRNPAEPVAPPDPTTNPTQQPDTTRRKGSLGLTVVVKRGNGLVEPLVSGSKVSPGDAIRFSITNDSAGQLAVLGLDAAGVVSTYTQPTRLQPGRDQVLEGSIVLDDTLGSERIVAILCKDIDMRELADRARTSLQRAGTNPTLVELADIAPTCEQSAFLLEKVPAGALE